MIAVSWVLFQLYTASATEYILTATKVRSIHLAFAIALAFLHFPTLKKQKGPSFLWGRKKIPILDLGFAVLGGLAALYITIDYLGIAERAGLPSATDIVFGITLVILLLEATRRAIGPALSVIALLFTLYSFFAPYMPGLLAARGVSVSRYISQVSLTTEGIFGIPLDVSAKVVFLFVLFGAMLNRSGGGQYFIKLALSMVGKYKGGAAKAAVVGSGLTGMISGSSIANIVTTGTFTIPLMKKVGYPAKKAAAIEVAASTDGQIAPPIMGAAAFIIAEYVNIPYLEVVKAAAVPAFASYATLFFITHLEASKLNIRGLHKDEIANFLETLKEGFRFLFPVFFLIYHLVFLRHSPELSAYYAVAMTGAIMIIHPLYLAWKKSESLWLAFKGAVENIVLSFVDCSKNMIPVALATATAGIIVAVVSMGLGGLITEIVQTLSMGNVYLMLVITAIASLIIGMGLPTTATYIVMASLIAPALVTVGAINGIVIPLISAHLFCFYFGILADDTPPVGLAAYAASAIAGSNPIETGVQGFLYDIRTAIIAFMFIFNTDLILYNVSSVLHGVFIFVAACLGCFAFASATQGWFLTKNKPIEFVLFLFATTLFLIPNVYAEEFSLPHRYFTFIPAIIIIAFVVLMQKKRLVVNQRASLSTN